MATQNETTPAHAKSLLTPREAAAYLDLSESHLAKLRCYGQGPRYSKLGARSVRYRRTDLDDWVTAASRSSTSGPEAA